MSAKLTQLAERRERLIAQAAAQRAMLGHEFLSLRKPLVHADQGLALLRSMQRHRVWIGSTIMLLAALRPGPFSKWLRRGWTTVQITRRLLAR